MWFLIGLVTGAGLLALVLWLRSRRIEVKWYEWIIASLGLGLLLFTVHDFFASFAEHEEYAAWTFLWVFGLPAIILLAVACFLAWRRHRKASSQDA